MVLLLNVIADLITNSFFIMLCSILITSMVLSLVQGQASPAPSSGTPGTPSKPDGQVTCDFNIEGSDPAIKQGN